jgi:DASS family divalent anion:Na+ symporter
MTFAVVLSLWSGTVFFGIDPTTAALLGFLALLATNVVTWDEVMGEKETWKTFVWFAGFVALSKLLSEKGVTKWIGMNIESILTSVSWDSKFIISISLLLFFYMHYFFASITVYASVMFISFAMLLINLGAPVLTVALVLASFANLSSCLTHYGITSAPIFFSNSKMSVKEWWFTGFLISIMHLLIWSTVGLAWFRIIGWI